MQHRHERGCGILPEPAPDVMRCCAHVRSDPAERARADNPIVPATVALSSACHCSPKPGPRPHVRNTAICLCRDARHRRRHGSAWTLGGRPAQRSRCRQRTRPAAGASMIPFAAMRSPARSWPCESYPLVTCFCPGAKSDRGQRRRVGQTLCVGRRLAGGRCRDQHGSPWTPRLGPKDSWANRVAGLVVPSIAR